MLNQEKHIIHQLLLRASMGKDIGLYHGKMGLILFFAHYYKHTGLRIYKDTADELMDEVIAEINTELPFGFAFGLSGIGWGIEYLIQNGFYSDDSLDICEEIDKKIMEKDPLRMTDYSLDSGIEGILHYVLAHIKGVISQHAITPFDDSYLVDLYQAVATVKKSVIISKDFKQLSTTYTTFYKDKKTLDYNLKLSSIIGEATIVNDDLNCFPLGLKDGIAGYLLKPLITESE